MLAQRSVFLALLLTLLNAQSPSTKQVIKQCTPNIEPIGQLCLDVTSNDCFDLTGKLTLRDNIVFSRTVAMSQMISMVAKRPANSGPVEYCQSFSNLNIPTPTPCTMCVTVDKLQLQGDDLTLCGKYQVNCSLGIKQDIPIPCFQITNCAIFGCNKGCNNGVCSPNGVCVCPSGYYGTDCSVSLSENCLKSSSSQTSCWNFNFPDCKSMSITTNAGTQAPQTINQSAVTLVPCQAVTNSECKVCMDAENIHTESNKLIGCPVIKESCNGLVLRHEVDCTTLATSDSLVCARSGDDTSVFSSANITKLILIVLAVILVASGLFFGGQLAYRKYLQRRENEFQQVPTSAEEVVPLGQAMDNW